MHTITKDMGITHGDFWRIIPAVAGDNPWSSNNDEVRIDLGEGQAIVRLGPEGRRVIAMFNLPSTPVTIDFSQVTEQQRSDFLALFDRRFQRGGG